MDIKPRISYLAITSLVFGLIFFIPIVTGIIAIITGIWGYKSIKNDSNLLGSGIAISGAVLGSIHAVFWIVIISAGITYTIDEGYSGVVTVDDRPVRVEEPGTYHRIPFYERVVLFPTSEIFELEPKRIYRVLFKSKNSADISFSVLWNVCHPGDTYVRYGRFEKRIIEERIKTYVLPKIRHEAVLMDSISELVANPEMESLMMKSLNIELENDGICLKSLNITSRENK